MNLSLKGNLASDIGLKPRIKLTVSLNGTAGPRIESDLCSQPKIEILQNGEKVCPPKQGHIYVVQRRHSLLVVEERELHRTGGDVCN